MRTVSTSPLLGSLVDLDVLDDEVAGVQALGIGVGLGVLEEVGEELGRLHGPAGLGDTELLACCCARLSKCPSNALCVCLLRFQLRHISMFISQCPSIQSVSSRKAAGKLTLGGAADGTGVPPHGDDLDLLLDILEVLEGAVELPAVDGLGGFPGVLEGNAEVGAAGASALRGLDVGGSVADLEKQRASQPAVFSKFGSTSSTKIGARAGGAIAVHRGRAACSYHREGV